MDISFQIVSTFFACFLLYLLAHLVIMFFEGMVGALLALIMLIVEMVVSIGRYLLTREDGSRRWKWKL